MRAIVDLSKPTEWATRRASPNLVCGFGEVMCQHGCIGGSKRAPARGMHSCAGADGGGCCGGVRAGGVLELSVFSAQFSENLKLL